MDPADLVVEGQAEETDPEVHLDVVLLQKDAEESLWWIQQVQELVLDQLGCGHEDQNVLMCGPQDDSDEGNNVQLGCNHSIHKMMEEEMQSNLNLVEDKGMENSIEWEEGMKENELQWHLELQEAIYVGNCCLDDN